MVEYRILWRPAIDDKAIDREMPFIAHLVELRRRLIVSIVGLAVGSVVAFMLYTPAVRFLIIPFERLGGAAGQNVLYATSIFEAFLVKLRVSVTGGLVLSFPVHVFNVVRFVFPGLRPRERRIVISALAASLALVAFAFYFGYYRLIPTMVSFLASPGFMPEHVGLLLGFERNLMYVLQFLLVCLAVFQLPIILEILLVLGVIKRKALLRASRYVMVGIFVLAAVVTPSPDMVSHISLALPLVALYFLTILVAKLLGFGEDRCSE